MLVCNRADSGDNEWLILILNFILAVVAAATVVVVMTIRYGGGKCFEEMRNPTRFWQSWNTNHQTNAGVLQPILGRIEVPGKCSTIPSLAYFGMRFVTKISLLLWSLRCLHCWCSNLDGEEESGERSPDAGDVLMLPVPNFTSSNSNRGGSNRSSIHGDTTDMHQAALLLTKLMTPLHQSNVTPLAFVSLQLEKVVCLLDCESEQWSPHCSCFH